MSTQPAGPHLVNGPCQKCQQQMEYIFPTPRIFNELDVSVIAFAHPPSRCGQCGTVHFPLVEGITAEGNIQLIWKPVKIGRAPMIVGGNDDALKKAIDQARFTEDLKKRGN